MTRRIPTAHKYYSIFKYLCEKGPASLSTITDYLILKYGMRYSTARPAVTRLYKILTEYGLVEDVGTDKRGSRIIDLTPKALSILITTISTYGASYFGFDPEIIKPAIKRLCPELLEKFNDYAKIVKEADKYRKGEKGDPYTRFVNEFFGYVVPLEEDFSGKRKYSCKDVEQAIDTAIKDIIDTLDREVKKDFEKAIAAIMSLDLRKETREILLKEINELLKKKAKEIRELRRRINILKRILKTSCSKI